MSIFPRAAIGCEAPTSTRDPVCGSGPDMGWHGYSNGSTANVCAPAVMEAIIRQIKWELQTTTHTSISPVSGLLNILALWLRDPNDTDCRQALAKLDGWIWEDEERGARVTGARSASWDTGFALQALATVPELDGVQKALRRGADFLRRQQIDVPVSKGFARRIGTTPKAAGVFQGDGTVGR